MSAHDEAAMNPNNIRPSNHLASEVPGDLKSLEARLAALSPRDDRLDRERLMYLAGRAAAENDARLRTMALSVTVDSRVWPIGFVGMTALAATLLAILVTRPAVVEVPPAGAGEIATSFERPESLPPAWEHRAAVRGKLLLASDALRHDIERLIELQGDSPADHTSAVTMPAYDDDFPALTPAAWRQVLNDAASAGPPANDSSSLSTFQGVNS